MRKDNSWQRTFNAKQQTIRILAEIPHSSYKAVNRKPIEEKMDHNQSTEQTTRTTTTPLYTPLLMAASTGIVEIVEKIIGMYPDAINHVSEDEQNILHMAVKHRRREIYRIIKKHEALGSLSKRITKKGRTVLHQVARMDYYREPREAAGVAFQLQDELLWFHVSTHYFHSLSSH